MKIFKKIQKYRQQKKLEKQKQKEFPIPKITHPYTQKINTRQKRYLLSFTIFLIFTLYYSHEHFKNTEKQNQFTSVVIANKDITAPKTLKKTDLTTIQIPKKFLPNTFFTKTEEILKHKLSQDLVKNEIILPHHLRKKIDPSSISSKFNSDFATTIDEDWFESVLPEIRKNDHIDILATDPKQNITHTKTIAKNLKIIEIKTNKNKKRTITVKATQKEAQSILFSKGQNLPLEILVHPNL